MTETINMYIHVMMLSYTCIYKLSTKLMRFQLPDYGEWKTISKT